MTNLVFMAGSLFRRVDTTPDITQNNGFIDVYMNTSSTGGFVDELQGNFDGSSAFTSTGAARPTDNNGVADWGSTALNGIHMLSPTWPGTIKEITFVLQYYDPDEWQFSSTNHDLIFNSASGQRLTTRTSGQDFGFRYSGSDTFRNLVRTNRPLMTREPIMLTITNPAGIVFPGIGNRSGTIDRGWRGPINAVIPFTEQQTFEERLNLYKWLKANTAFKIPDDALGNYARIYNVTDGVEVYTLGDQTHSSDQDSMTKVLTALTIYDAVQNAEITMADTITMNAGHGTGGALTNGVTHTVSTLLQLALCTSDNRAATALGEYLGNQIDGGGVASWVTRCTALIASIGMTGTTVLEPAGLNTTQTMTVTDADLMMRHVYNHLYYESAPLNGVSIKSAMSAQSFSIPAPTSSTVNNALSILADAEYLEGSMLTAKGGFKDNADLAGLYHARNGKTYTITVLEMPGANADDTKVRREECASWAMAYIEDQNELALSTGYVDPVESDVQLKVRFNGSYADESPQAWTMAANGAQSIETTAPIEGSGSFLANGTDYLTADEIRTRAWQFVDDFDQNVDFTVEMFMKSRSDLGAVAGGDGLICAGNPTGNSRWVFFVHDNTQFSIFAAGDIQHLTYSGNLLDDVEHHIAWVREGTTCSLYIDGLRVDTTTEAHNYRTGTTGGQLLIGTDKADIPNRTWNNGMIDQVCVTHSARYSGASFNVAASTQHLYN